MGGCIIDIPALDGRDVFLVQMEPALAGGRSILAASVPGITPPGRVMTHKSRENR
jgi:hypothetical protein